MQEIQGKINRMVELMGFRDFEVEMDDATRRVSILIHDRTVSQEDLPVFVFNVDRIARLMAKKLDMGPVVVDVNHYRRERERLIVELARAAARKASMIGEPVDLPPMNAYERRLVHTELAVRPDVETESLGEGRNRYVIVRPL